LTSDSLNDRADRARLATATLLMSLGLDDIDIAMETAKNAVENNFVPLIAAASVAWEIYAVTHEEELAQTKESIINYVAEKTGFSREMVENTFNGLTFLTSVTPTKVVSKIGTKIGVQVGKKIGKTVTKKIVTTTLGSDIDKNALVGKVKRPTTEKNLLQGEGKVGTYESLGKIKKRGSNLASHHIPNSNYMQSKGVSHNNGVSMMVEQPTPGSGGRHREIHKTMQKQDTSLEPRQALSNSIKRAKEVYKKDGLYEEIRPNLLEVIKKNKETFPNLFDKNK
jgi:hypothetical protein